MGLKAGSSAVGSAPGSGPGGQGFKSPLPDLFYKDDFIFCRVIRSIHFYNVNSFRKFFKA